MKKSKTFHLKVYDTDLKFIICPDIQKEFNRISRRKKDLNVYFSGDAGGLAFPYYIHEYYILLRDDCVAHSYISHEILHTVERITRDRGIRDEEARAYLCGHITKVVYQYLDEQKIKIHHG